MCGGRGSSAFEDFRRTSECGLYNHSFIQYIPYSDPAKTHVSCIFLLGESSMDKLNLQTIWPDVLFAMMILVSLVGLGYAVMGH